MSQTFSSPAAAVPAVVTAKAACNITPVLILFGALLNGYMPQLITWAFALGGGAAPGLPIGVLDLMVAGIAVSFLMPRGTRLAVLRPGMVDFLAAAGCLAPSSAVAFGIVFLAGCFYGLLGKRSEQWAGYWLLAGLGAVNLWNSVIVIWFATPFGAVDAALAQKLLSVFAADAFRTGNIVGVGGGHSIIMFYGCTTAFLLPKLMLVQAGALMWRETESLKRLGLAVLAVAAIAWLLNIVRLALMASSPTLYEYLHSPAAFSLFDVLLLGGVFLTTLLAEGRQA